MCNYQWIPLLTKLFRRFDRKSKRCTELSESIRLVTWSNNSKHTYETSLNMQTEQLYMHPIQVSLDWTISRKASSENLEFLWKMLSSIIILRPLCYVEILACLDLYISASWNNVIHRSVIFFPDELLINGIIIRRQWMFLWMAILNSMLCSNVLFLEVYWSITVRYNPLSTKNRSHSSYED